MADAPKSDQEQPESTLSPFMEQAGKKLETEPSRAMVAHIPKSPADSKDKDALLRPSGTPLARSLMGHSVLEDRTVAFGTSGMLLLATGGVAAGVATEMGYLSMLQMSVALCVLAVCTMVFGVSLGFAASRTARDLSLPAWELPRPGTRRPTVPSKRRTVLSGGEEEQLARHSAAALWNLHDGDGAKAWKSDSFAEWRARLDLREEAAQTIRSAGALQDLRESLGHFPAHCAPEAQSAWKADYAIYSAGLAALRERVQRQLSLQLAVEEAGRQLNTPQQDRQILTGRIAADLPSHELAVENLSEIANQSADLVGLLALQEPSAALPASGLEINDQADNGSPSDCQNSTNTNPVETT